MTPAWTHTLTEYNGLFRFDPIHNEVILNWFWPGSSGGNLPAHRCLFPSKKTLTQPSWFSSNTARLLRGAKVVDGGEFRATNSGLYPAAGFTGPVSRIATHALVQKFRARHCSRFMNNARWQRNVRPLDDGR